MTAHAILSASGSKKWIACPPSARLEEQMPDESSRYSAEGTLGHDAFEALMSQRLGMISATDYAVRMSEVQRHELYSTELMESVTAAADRATDMVRDIRAECPDATVLLEQRLDFSEWVPEGFGTGDLVIVADRTLVVADLKLGKGVLVSATDNSQMRLYGLGALAAYESLYDIERVRTVVLQPRLENYGAEELSVEELKRWADDVVRPAATLAWSGEGEFKPGKHCTDGFCKARFQCAARNALSVELAKADFALKPPELLTMEQITTILAKADLAIDWLNDVKSFAQREAEAGREVPGYKLVEGRSVRKYADPDAVAGKLAQAGIDESLIYERNLLGITAMEKMLGKKQFAALLDGLVVKPAGKPTLVPVGDKRPALPPAASPAADFS